VALEAEQADGETETVVPAESAEPVVEEDPAADGELAADDLLSAFDELAPHSEPAEEPAEAEAVPEPEAPSAPTTTLVIDSSAEATAKLDPLVPPSVQADIDHDWVIPDKPSAQTPRSLSAYANSLPSLPRPTPAEPEVLEPVATSAPDDWFRPGVAEPVDRGPRPVRQTAFLDPDKERTAVAPAYGDDGPEFEEAGDEHGDPGGPRRKTLVGAVTAAVLLVAGAAAVVLGGTGDSGPAPAAQSSTGGPGAGTPSGDASPGTPSGTDNSSALQTSAGNVPVSRHSSSHSTSKTSKSTPSSNGTPSSHATSQDSATSHSSSSSTTSPSGTPSSGGTSTTPTGTGSSTPTHSSTSSPSSDHTSPSG
jgi:hypothetical protein